jgi:hypothetical protein
MIPSYLTIRKKKGTFVLCAAEDIPHRRMVGITSVTHPHIHVGNNRGYGGEGSLVITALGAFLTTSTKPNCKLRYVMLSAGWDWGLHYDDAWCLHLTIKQPIKKGEILTVRSLTESESA